MRSSEKCRLYRISKTNVLRSHIFIESPDFHCSRLIVSAVGARHKLSALSGEEKRGEDSGEEEWRG